MNDWIDYAANWASLPRDTVGQLVQTGLIVLLVVLTRFAVLRVVRRRVTDVKRHYYWRRAINYACGFFLALLIGSVWISGLRESATFLGLITAGVAIALQDPLANFAAWLFILARRPFRVGDRIELDGHIGDVIDIRLFQTYLMECGHWVDADQSTGRMIAIPNGVIFRQTCANYTRGFEYIWDEAAVLVTFESDWRKAKSILLEIGDGVAQPFSAGAQDQVRQAAHKQMIFFQNLTPIVYTTVRDSGVMLTLRYLTPPRRRRGNAEKVWEAVLDAFGNESSIDFAYPTVRYYQNQIEGKPDARAAIQPQAPASS